jgi:methylglutaconyl-CoA hydratase
MSEAVLNVEREGSCARVTLARPAVRNAFNAEMIAALREAFAALGQAEDVRTIVLAGEGKVFSGGADVNWMRASLELSEDENVRDAAAMAEMFGTIDRCPKPVIARVQGAALGGGMGLAAVADIVVAADDAVFGFTETKLGIVPAVISEFVLPKIGPSHARALYLTGERFDAERARAIGLVHFVVEPDWLDAKVAAIVAEFRTSGPLAVAAAKALIPALAAAGADEARDLTSRAIARARTTAEGQEGLKAFLERRPASWHES